PEAVKYHYQAQEYDVGKASHDNDIVRVRGLVGWLAHLESVLEMLQKKRASCGKQAKNMKSRRRGFYVLLYGGRVNLNTFYDYKDTLGDGRV
ncbi:hypothetical protein C0992_000192, partial [Termitomyces sp. T32_za158]